MPTATFTINGVLIEMEGTEAELTSMTSLLVKQEAPAKRQPKAAPEPTKTSRKAGTRTTPKAERPVIHRKTEGIGEGKALTKDTRAAFAKAFLKAFGEPNEAIAKEIGAKGTVLHWSTKQLATYAVATLQVPKGYQVAAGYYRLVGPKAEEAIRKAKGSLPEAPKGRVRNAKGQFVKQS